MFRDDRDRGATDPDQHVAATRQPRLDALAERHDGRDVGERRAAAAAAAAADSAVGGHRQRWVVGVGRRRRRLQHVQHVRIANERAHAIEHRTGELSPLRLAREDEQRRTARLRAETLRHCVRRSGGASRGGYARVDSSARWTVRGDEDG